MTDKGDKGFVLLMVVCALIAGLGLGTEGGCNFARRQHCRALTGQPLHRVDDQNRIICQVLQDAPSPPTETP